jgi:hypothetical protein
MAEKISFNAEIKYEGGIKDFQKWTKVLAEVKGLKLTIPNLPKDIGIAGGWPFPMERLLDKNTLANMARGATRIKLAKYLCGTTCGGINNPHIHVKDEVIFLDRQKFKEVSGLVAMKLAGDLASKVKHKDMVGTIRNIMPKPK